MATITVFHRVPTAKLGALLEAATPRKSGLFGRRKDHYWEFLESEAEEVADLDWQGGIVAGVLVYLQEEGVDLLDSGEHDALALRIAEFQEIGATILTPAHRAAYLDRLSAEPLLPARFSSWYADFSEEEEDPELGGALQDVVAAFRTALAAVDDESVVLVTSAD